MSSRRFLISAAICVAATYGAYYEQTRYDLAAEAAKARAVYRQMARGDAADASKRCREDYSDTACNQVYQETLRSAKSWYGEHGGAYNVVNDTETRNLYLVVALISGLVAFFQLRRWLKASDSTARRMGAQWTDPAGPPRGASGSEVAFPATARETAFSTPSTTQSKTVAATERHTKDLDFVASAPVYTATQEDVRHGTAPGGLKSAGNPLVRRAFVRAMKEVDTNTSVSELWAMALTECSGDEHAARLAYMKVRAETILWGEANAAEATRQTKQAE